MSDAWCLNDDALVGTGRPPVFPVVAETAVQHGPISGMATTGDGGQLVVANYGSNSVSFVDAYDCALRTTVLGIGEPFAVAANAGRAYVSAVTPAYDVIIEIDVNTGCVTRTHPVALSVSDLAVSIDGKYVYASRTGVSGVDVAVLDTATGIVDSIAIPSAPGTVTECLRLSPDGRRLYVAVDASTGGRLVVIDTKSRSVVSTLDVGMPVRDIALSPDGRTAYLAGCGPDFEAVVDVIDTRGSRVLSTFKVGEVAGLLTRLTLSVDGGRAYLVSEGAVTAWCTRTYEVIGVVAVGSQPSCVTESPDGRYLHIADHRGMVSTVNIAPLNQAMATDADWAMPELLTFEPVMA